MTEIRVVGSEAEHAQLYAFRYRVYVDELRIPAPEADHERRWLRDPIDEHSINYALFADGEVRGAVRLTLLDRVPDPAPLIAKYALEPALAEMDASRITLAARFMVDPGARHGAATAELVTAPYAAGRKLGCRLSYTDCSPHLLTFYEAMGFRRYTRAFTDSAYGFKVPLVLLGGDREHFARLGSPFLAVIGGEQPDDGATGRWFETTYPDWRPAESAALLPEGEFLDRLATHVANDPLHSVGLLHGLDRDEARRFLARATVVEAARGDAIVREGESGDTLFVLLKGVAEVVQGGTAPRTLGLLGAGDSFGEMGFLTTGSRCATVLASTACEIVVLSSHFLRDFMAEDAAVAAKVLLNLSRTLAERLAASNARI